MEIWKTVIVNGEVNEKYMVANLGNVKRLGNNKSRKEKILKLEKNKGNYLHVVLSKNGKRKTCKVHRLVAFAFIPKIEGKTHVDHIDGNRQNNNVNNLRWCTIAENNNFDLCRKHRSEANSKKVLCVELNRIFESNMEVERDLGINNRRISECCNGKIKSAGKHPVTGERLHWKYIDINE